MRSTAHRCPGRPPLLPNLPRFTQLKPTLCARHLLMALGLGSAVASCAVDEAEPGYERVCRVDDQKDRRCDDELLPSTAHEAERQCTLESQRYYDAYNQLLADCYEPLSCGEWNNMPADEASGDAGAGITKGECEDEARQEFGENDACKDYCDAWLEAEDDLCGRTGSEPECLLANCIYDAKILANAVDCTKLEDCDAYEDCLATALE